LEKQFDHEDSLKYYRYLKNSLDAAKEEKAIEIAKKALQMGLSVDDIVKLTGLDKKIVDQIQTNTK
jgi:hypothetical protein